MVLENDRLILGSNLTSQYPHYSTIARSFLGDHGSKAIRELPFVKFCTFRKILHLSCGFVAQWAVLHISPVFRVDRGIQKIIRIVFSKIWNFSNLWRTFTWSATIAMPHYVDKVDCVSDFLLALTFNFVRNFPHPTTCISQLPCECSSDTSSNFLRQPCDFEASDGYGIFNSMH